MPYLIGRVKDATGSPAGAFLMLAGVGLAAALLSLLLRRQPAFAVPPLARPRVPSLAAGAVGD